MNISNLENNLQALNAQMQSYFASQDEVLYSNSFKISNIGREAELIDENKLYIRTNYTIPTRINSNNTSMSMPPGSYMIVENARIYSMGVPEDVYLSPDRYVIGYSPIIGNVYWDNGTLYQPYFQAGGVDTVTTNVDSRWFYTDEVRNTRAAMPILLNAGDTFGYTLEDNTEYVPNEGHSSFEANFNFVHDGNLTTENADINQLRGRDVSVIINNSNFNASNFESPTLVNSRLYNANMSLNGVDTISPRQLTSWSETDTTNDGIFNSNFYNASLKYAAHINEFTAIDINANDVGCVGDFEWDNFNVNNVRFDNAIVPWEVDRNIRLPYIADNSVLAANNSTIVATTQDLVTSNLAFDYTSGYNAVYKHALDDFNNFISNSEQQFNNLADNRGEEQEQALYNEINNVENSLVRNITHQWNIYWDTLNNLHNVCDNSLKNMVNYPINNAYERFGEVFPYARYFDVAFNDNIANNYMDMSTYPNYNRYGYEAGKIIEFQGKQYNSQLITLRLNGFVWQCNNTSNMFANCNNLYGAYNYIPLGLEDASNMFYNCILLNIPIQFYSNTVNNLAGFAYNVRSPYVNIRVNQDLNLNKFIQSRYVNSITFSSDTPKRITDASQLAYYCNNATNIAFSNLDIVGPAIDAFMRCNNLRNFNGHIKTYNAVNMFRNCSILQSNIYVDVDEFDINLADNKEYPQINYANAFNNIGFSNLHININAPNDITNLRCLNMTNMLNNSYIHSLDLNIVAPNVRTPAGWGSSYPAYDLSNVLVNTQTLRYLNLTFAGGINDAFNLNNFMGDQSNGTGLAFTDVWNINIKVLNLPGANKFNTTNMFPNHGVNIISINSLYIDLSEWDDMMPFSDNTFNFLHMNYLTIKFGNPAHQATINNWLICGRSNNLSNIGNIKFE